MPIAFAQVLCSCSSNYTSATYGCISSVWLIRCTEITPPELSYATASGRKAGTTLSHGITPHSLSMTEGITSAINSCTAIDYSVFNGGASAMWDLSPEFATPQIIKSLFMTYFKQGGQIFQGNTTDVNELLKARENPEAYHHLFVRVGGFSARFVGLAKSIQDEIIARIRHNK